MRNKKSFICIAVGSAMATSLGGAPVSAADDLFAAQPLDKGYMLAYADRVDPNKYGGAKSPGYGGTKSAEGQCGMSRLDVNKDGKVTKEEFLKHHETIFDSIDTNKDGAVDQPEADGYAKRSAAAPDAAPHGAMKK
ncbi:MAG: hypothetical protein KGM95_01205 [Betaproteobacteria bacterium]|nr:hypothetical protein [Betaproteobacteria bacterium]